MKSRLPLQVLAPLVLLAFAGCAQTAERRGSLDELARDAGLPPAPLESDEANAQFHILAGEMAANRDQPELAAREFLKALEYVDDADLANRATVLAIGARDDAMAEKAARRWLALEPASMDAREVILRISLTRGDRDAAMEQARAMVTGHAGGVDEGLRHVSLLLGQLEEKHAQAAVGFMQDLAGQWPDEPAAQHALGLVALRYGQLELADQAARKALTLEPTNKEHSLLLVGVLVKRELLDEASTLVDQLVKGDPKAAELRMGYAKLLLEAGKREAARAQLQRVADLKPEMDDARFALGVLALNDRDYEVAEKHLLPLLQGERGQDAAMQLGRLEEARKRWDKAISYYSRVTSGIQSLDAVTRRASVMGRAGQLDEAQGLMRQLRENFPQLATRFYLAEGEMLLGAEANERALAMYAKALEEFPDDADLLYGRSLVYERLAQVKPAEDDLRAILKLNAEDSRAMNALGYMLVVHTSRLDEARQLITRALELTPDDAAVIDSLGWVEFREGNHRAARTLLEKAFGKVPDPEIAAHLGEVLWVLGEKDRARAIWEAALTRDPGHRVLKETMERLTR